MTTKTGAKTPLNTTRVLITYRDGRTYRETHTEHDAWKLTTTYNRTAYAAGVIDVVVEWDDEPEAELEPEAPKAVDHADHLWEEWHAYLSETVPEGADLNSTGIYCHDCQLVIVDGGAE